jgi:hypothetical protein
MKWVLEEIVITGKVCKTGVRMITDSVHFIFLKSLFEATLKKFQQNTGCFYRKIYEILQVCVPKLS